MLAKKPEDDTGTQKPRVIVDVHRERARSYKKRPTCRSEHAREKPEDDTGIQKPRVIVDVHREQARSYRKSGMPCTAQGSSVWVPPTQF